MKFMKKQTTVAHRGQSRALLQPRTSVEYKGRLQPTGNPEILCGIYLPHGKCSVQQRT